MEINFSSKVYSKSLLKVWSLIGSVVYSLILDYQFCACVMWVSGVPQLQVIHMERLYVYHCFTDGRIWASLGRVCVS